MLVRLVTVDGYEVPLTEEFIRTHLDNGVFPRLLGWEAEDGLTTREPRRDRVGRHTILSDLGVSREAILELLRFLRVGGALGEAGYQASLCIGGVEACDRLLRGNGDKCRDAAETAAYNPMTPRDDCRSAFRWSIIHSAHTTNIAAMVEDGWSVTTAFSYYVIYLRREIASSSS